MKFSYFFVTIILCLVTVCTAIAQNINKVYLDSADSSKSCYTILSPSGIEIRGYLLLIPGMGETAESVVAETLLPKQLAKNGILTIIPTFQDGPMSLGIDEASQNSLKAILNDVGGMIKLSDQQFFIGGFSIGGSAALRYAELASADGYGPKPAAVFAIDPPLDFERFYHSCKRDIRLSGTEEPNQESIYMIDRLEKVMNGSPETKLESYRKYSPYSFSDTTQRAIKSLLNIPVRIYSEPDVSWWMKERHADLSSMNALDCSAMVNELNRLGNGQASLITSQGKGYRKAGNTRHPHSWSIVDNDNLVQWLLQIPR